MGSDKNKNVFTQSMQRDPLPHIPKGEKVPEGLKRGYSKTVFVGKVIRIHSQKNLMDVQFLDGGDTISDTVISYPYQGNVGFMGVCPEPGSLGIFLQTPLGFNAVSFINPSPEYSGEYRMVENVPEGVSDPVLEQSRVNPFMFRTLRAGEGRLASKYNSEVFLNEDVEIHDSMGNEVRLRSGDGSLMNTSQQNYMFTTGVWRSAGPIQRNSLRPTIGGVEQGGINAKEVTHSDGTRAVYIGGDYGYNNSVYNEYRLEVEDTCILSKPLNDINSGSNITTRTPKTIFVIGNMVGNNSNDVEEYGKFLTPDFITEERGDGGLNFSTITPNATGDVLGTKGVAWGFHVPKKSFIGMTKEGVQNSYFGQSSGDNPGVSQIVVASGGKIEEWGFAKEERLSQDLFTRGGIRWVIGKGKEDVGRGLVPRSFEARYIGGTYTEHGFTSENDPKSLKDIDGNEIPYYLKQNYRRIERVNGYSRDEVSSNSESFIGGSYFVQVGGVHEMAASTSVESVRGDKTINTSSAFSVNASDIKHSANERETSLMLGDTKTIKLGNDETTIDIGNHSITSRVGSLSRNVQAAGNIEDSTFTGNISHSITAGNFSANVTAGNINMNTTAGTVSVGGTTISVDALASIDITAPFVNLGLSTTRSGVITQLSHLDYITGAPLLPSFTVYASR